ncbi:hypothetical protein DB88DRAFT_290711 [Papiliotrema laurentii]|uniref:Uncharacterized protein n=1 Tax=Papiliotrema laurentii TaxID=5418 RepID=A0AAD9L5M7_PAPLA|nr:hypothetical protein DB88DRAFT_290711 [Papiliotrema laurentii]
MYALKPLLVLSATLSLTLAKPLPSDEELPADNLRGGVITPKPTQQNDMVYSVILNVPSMARVQDVKNGEPVKGSWQLIGPEKKTIQFKDASDPNPFIRQEVLLTTYLDTKDEDWKKIKADQEDKTKKKKRPFPKKSVRRTCYIEAPNWFQEQISVDILMNSPYIAGPKDAPAGFRAVCTQA